jgi:hypothetical protein
MKRSIAVIGLTLALAGCGGDQTASTTPTPSPAASASPSPTAASGSLTGGMGNTATNPDATYGCVFKGFAANGTTVIDYVTVAGPTPASLCPFFASLTNYQAATNLTIPKTPVCWMTSADGQATARFYTPAGANSAATKTECSWELQDAASS